MIILVPHSTLSLNINYLGVIIYDLNSTIFYSNQPSWNRFLLISILIYLHSIFQLLLSIKHSHICLNHLFFKYTQQIYKTIHFYIFSVSLTAFLNFRCSSQIRFIIFLIHCIYFSILHIPTWLTKAINHIILYKIKISKVYHIAYI